VTKSLLRLELQRFESDILGQPVYRLTILDSADARLADELGALVRAWADENIGLCSCRIDAADARTGAVLEAAGFRRIEHFLTLQRDLPRSIVRPGGIDVARPSDHAACLALGRTAFSCDRFHADPRFPTAVAGAIKEAWVRNSFAGRADCCLVVRHADDAIGFALCRLAAGAPVLDLIAVAPAFRRRGHARRLVEAAMAHYAGSAATISVSTQQDNLPAVALYEDLGFAAFKREATYHFIK